MLTVFSPRLEVNTRSSASETRAPATRGSPGMERTYLWPTQSMTSTASFAVGHVEETPWSVHGGVIEAAGGHVRGKIDVADMLQRHASLRDA